MLFLRYYLWVVPHLLLGILLPLAWRRGWHKRLPIFFAFLVFTVVDFLVLFALSRLVGPSSIEVYRWALVLGLAVGSLLQLAVLFELARELLLSRTLLASTLRPLLTWTLGGLVLVAAAVSASFAAIGLQRTTRIFQVVDFSSSLIQVGLLLVLLLFSRALQISWRSWATGVAVGFGISACVNLATAALRSGLGKSAVIAVDITQMSALHVSVVVWLIYVFLPDRTPAFSGRGFGESDIHLWDHELQRMTGQ
jgi:hypothetical protein